ncbi:Putative uncharacterized protein [Lactobacillus equicursoris DSM 19284 = JCM 14600 = CIP 110162]|uniref:Pyridoxamine 5'-phosphate oxidase N-terminal domain-containing protein n=2 Tax=Lactobacillus equicursoris TaxID=420645 RepID=K0NNR6_9LACO|nr:pyridoxamine 5'-phosphate oxidase family protein [Lactobacillus equicursoris]CCK83359.1 Putative uncharacterized protein [Lactobacillus equicursoris 66c]CCK85664.1 Putative uncharacterized protein [Lactobacillus equicursoris DSM 19284 = JCM 14600 = CIP 110162]
MRKQVPMLDDSLSKAEFLSLIPAAFQSVVFATIADGRPFSNVADIELEKDGKLYFATTYQKAFYQRLHSQPYVSITALKGEETMSSVGFTLNGTVEEVDLSYLDLIYASHPEMLEINKTESERRELLRPFAITPIDGFVYDLRQTPIFQKGFKF